MWTLCMIETSVSQTEEEELQAINHTVSTVYYLCLQKRLCYHWYSKVQPDTYKSSQEFLHRMAVTVEILMEAVQEKSTKFLDIPRPSMPACLVIPINEDLWESAKLLWQMSASLVLTVQMGGLLLSSAFCKLWTSLYSGARTVSRGSGPLDKRASRSTKNNATR